jgi:hypothetical protein
MEIPESGFKIVRKNEFMIPHHLKEYLGVGCVTKHVYKTLSKRVFSYSEEKYRGLYDVTIYFFNVVSCCIILL